MTQEEYIEECMKKIRLNIDEFSIGDLLIDKADKSEVQITDKTASSIQILIKAKTKNGITCKQWFDMERLNRKFTKK